MHFCSRTILLTPRKKIKLDYEYELGISCTVQGHTLPRGPEEVQPCEECVVEQPVEKNSLDMQSKMFNRCNALSKIDGPHGWIQWKGTDVCMDIRCACGKHSHLDTDFAYFFRCSGCGEIYDVSSYVKLTPLTPEEKEYVESHCKNVIKTDAGEE